MAACAVKSLGGTILGRLAPQDDQERENILDTGYDPKTIFHIDDLVKSEQIFFAATGITNGPIGSARWALFRDGHRLTAEPAYYRDLRRAFYLGGFGSEAFTSLYTAPLQLWRPVGNEPPRVFRRAR